MMEKAAVAVAGIQTFTHKLGRPACKAERVDENRGSLGSSSVPSIRQFCVPAPPEHTKMPIALFRGGTKRMMGSLSGLQDAQPGARFGGTVNELESSIWGKAIVSASRRKVWSGNFGGERKECKKVLAMAGAVKTPTQMNLDQYMVTVDHPTGIRFAQNLSGKIYVDALAKNGNADRARIVMVGDVLKKVSAVSGDALVAVQDVRHTVKTIKARNGPISLIFERSSPSFRSSISTSCEVPFNVGLVPVPTWDSNNLVPPYQPSDRQNAGNVGFVTYSSTLLLPKGLQGLANSGGVRRADLWYGDEPLKGLEAASRRSYADEEAFEVVGSYTDDETDNIEWTHGNYNKDEYESALERAESDLCYNPALGMNCTKITENIYVGSCIQGESDVHLLVDKLGITAVLNLQRKSEQDNWGIDGEAIERLAREKGLFVVNFPIRDVDAVDLRRKLPFSVGVLYRLLRKGHRVYVTCTTGLDRSPACVIAYLHWIQDVALQEAVDYIKNLHPCGPDRPALVWATWDLIAMAEREDHRGPPTHAVQFVWNHGCRDGEEVLLVGEFKGGWNEPIKAMHASGPKFTVDLRLPQGKYTYKFIVGGHWRHSSSLPTEGDQWGNINNVIKVGDVATTKFDAPHRPHVKDLNSIKVIERPLTDDERFTLAFATRRMAFAIDPSTLAPKQ